MMKWWPRKKRPYTKGKSLSEKEKESGFKSREWANKKLLEMAKDNPELQNEYIAKLVGFDIKPLDPNEKKKREIRGKLYDHALGEIEKDPELRSRLAERQISELIGEIPERDERYPAAGPYDGKGSIRQLLDDLEDAEELGTRLGKGKGSALGGLIDADVIRAIVENLPALLGSRGVTTAGASSRVYVVETADGLIEMTPAQYKAHLEEKNRAQIAAPKPAEDLKEQVTQPEELEEAPPEQKPLKLNIVEWIPFLDSEPSEFVYEIMGKVDLGDEQATLLVNFLKNVKDADSILSLLETLKDTAEPEVVEAIDKLKEQKEWVEEVINTVKTIMSEGE